MMTQPTLAAVQRGLDALAASARSGDHEDYLRVLRAAQNLGDTEEQIFDAYRWGRRGAGAAPFDHRGETDG